MTKEFSSVQRIVLRGNVWQVARHLVFSFPEGGSRLYFLKALESHFWPTADCASKPALQVSLGFSRRGLERALVPAHVLALFALKAPAFSAGAALRASSKLGASGRNVPQTWEPAFDFMSMDAVLSLHAVDEALLDDAVEHVRRIAGEQGVPVAELPVARKLLRPPPPGQSHPRGQWVHFGFRDGLARVGIQGSTAQATLDKCKPASIHQAGEFLLGHPQDSGANPWIAGPQDRVWPKELRTFFRNGSFGVLHQVEQDVTAFEAFIEDKAKALGSTSDELKAKLCGRYPDGRAMAADRGTSLDADFDYAHDPNGYRCPFGSHVRRMNPRGNFVSHSDRSRAVLRRGMPYGPDWVEGTKDTERRGLIGHFFCTSIEDQFEHLVGQWADRVPLGSADRGRARDPLIGAHEPGDGAFEIPRPDGRQIVTGLRPFTRICGTAYLFYPSLVALDGIANNSPWIPENEGDI